MTGRLSSRLSGLYAITRMHPEGSHALFDEVSEALAGGVRILQYRDKSLETKRRLLEARQLVKQCQAAGALLIVNDDVALAVQVQADGVHLGRGDGEVEAARAQLGKEAIIGVSCYNELLRAEAAERQGADYVAFGSFFPSLTKPQAPRADPALLVAWQSHPVPACAIGGVTLQRAQSLVEAGADMVAVISDLWQSDEVRQTAQAFSGCWSDPATV